MYKTNFANMPGVGIGIYMCFSTSFNFSNIFQWAHITFHKKEEKRLLSLQRKKTGKAKTHGPGLWYPSETNSPPLSELCEGLGEAAGGKRSSYVTHPDQTLKSLPKNSATANNTAPGLHLYREGAGRARLKSGTWNTERVTQPFCLLRTNPFRPRSPRTSFLPGPVPYPSGHHDLPTWRSGL